MNRQQLDLAEWTFTFSCIAGAVLLIALTLIGI